MPWFTWLSEPVRLPRGLKVHLQQSVAQHLRILPPATVTFTMSAKEINTDVALFGIAVYNKANKAIVSVREIPATNAGAASIEET